MQSQVFKGAITDAAEPPTASEIAWCYHTPSHRASKRDAREGTPGTRPLPRLRASEGSSSVWKKGTQLVLWRGELCFWLNGHGSPGPFRERLIRHERTWTGPAPPHGGVVRRSQPFSFFVVPNHSLHRDEPGLACGAHSPHSSIMCWSCRSCASRFWSTDSTAGMTRAASDSIGQGQW